jgi:hypothetical protein
MDCGSGGPTFEPLPTDQKGLGRPGCGLGPGLVAGLEPPADFKSVNARHSNVQEDELR